MVLTLRLISKPDNAILLNEEKRFEDEGGSIGRADHCELILPDDTKHISKIHALIHFRDEHYFITDVSSNGVFVNTETVPIGKGNTKQLVENDKIRIGGYILQTSLADTIASPKIEITSVSPVEASFNDDLENLLADSHNADDMLTAEPTMNINSSATDEEQSIDDLLASLSDDPAELDIDTLHSSDAEIADLLAKSPQTNTTVDVMASLNAAPDTDAMIDKVLGYCTIEAYLSFCMGKNIELSDDEAVYNKAILERFFTSLHERKSEIKSSL